MRGLEVPWQWSLGYRDREVPVSHYFGTPRAVFVSHREASQRSLSVQPPRLCVDRPFHDDNHKSLCMSPSSVVTSVP